MGYTKGEAKTKHLYNVVSKMGATGKKYPKLSSYCMGQDGRHAIVMSEDKLKGYSSVLVGLHPYQSIIIGKRHNMGHANDIAYSNGYYYIVKGGGDVSSDRVLRYNTSMQFVDFFECEKNVTSIACFSKNKFIFGKGDTLYLMEMDNKSKAFKIICTGTIERKGTALDGWINQGMCYYNSYLYKVYGKATSGRIRNNYIAKFVCRNNNSKRLDLTLTAIYDCSKTDQYLFEIEGISVTSTGLYVAVDKRESKVSDYKVAIYQVQLK